MARPSSLAIVILLQILFLFLFIFQGVLAASLPSTFDVPAALHDEKFVSDEASASIISTASATVAFSPVSSSSPVSSYSPVSSSSQVAPQSSEPVGIISPSTIVYSVLGVFGLGTLAVYKFKKRKNRSDTQSQSSDADETGEGSQTIECPAPSTSDQGNQQEAGKTPPRKLKKKNKKTKKANAEDTDKVNTNPTNGNADNQSTASSSGSTRHSDDGPSKEPTLVTSSSGFKVPESLHNTSTDSDPFADPKDTEGVLTSTPVNSKDDVSSLFSPDSPAPAPIPASPIQGDTPCPRSASAEDDVSSLFSPSSPAPAPIPAPLIQGDNDASSLFSPGSPAPLPIPTQPTQGDTPCPQSANADSVSTITLFKPIPRDEWLELVKVHRERSKKASSAWMEEYAKGEAERLAREAERNEQYSKEFKRKRSPVYLTRVAALQNEHPVESLRTLTPFQFDTKMRQYAHTSPVDVKTIWPHLTKTYMPHIYEGRDYVEKLDGVRKDIWLVVDGLAEGDVDEFYAEARKHDPATPAMDNACAPDETAASNIEDVVVTPAAEANATAKEQPKEIPRIPSGPVAPEQPDVFFAPSVLATPALVYSPASPASTSDGSSTMPPTPAPGSHFAQVYSPASLASTSNGLNIMPPTPAPGSHLIHAVPACLPVPSSVSAAKTVAVGSTSGDNIQIGLGLRILDSDSQAKAKAQAVNMTTTSASSSTGSNRNSYTSSTDASFDAASSTETTPTANPRNRRQRIIDGLRRTGTAIISPLRRGRRSSNASTADIDIEANRSSSDSDTATGSTSSGDVYVDSVRASYASSSRSSDSDKSDNPSLDGVSVRASYGSCHNPHHFHLDLESGREDANAAERRRRSRLSRFFTRANAD